MSIAQETFRNLTGLVGYALKTFAFTVIAVAVGYGGLLAVSAYLIAADGSLLRGSVATILSLVATSFFACYAAVQLTIVRTVQQAIKQAAVGSKVFNRLFDIMLGITDENPSGSSELTQSLHGITRDELQQRLTAAAKTYLRHERIEAALPRFARWLMRKVQTVLVWTVVKVAMIQATLLSDGPNIDLLKIRGSLADMIDNKLAAYLRANNRRVLLGIGFAVAAGVLLLAWGIRFAPVSLEEAGLGGGG